METTMARVRIFDASQQVISVHDFPSLATATEAFYGIVAETPPTSHVQYEAALILPGSWVVYASVPGGFNFTA
jgi:hypothetical protein